MTLKGRFEGRNIMNRTRMIYLISMGCILGITTSVGYYTSRKSYKQGCNDGILIAEKFNELNHIYHEVLHTTKERVLDEVFKDIES